MKEADCMLPVIATRFKAMSALLVQPCLVREPMAIVRDDALRIALRLSHKATFKSKLNFSQGNPFNDMSVK